MFASLRSRQVLFPTIALSLLAGVSIGCRPESHSPPPTSAATTPPPTVRLLVIGDQPLGNAIAQQWQSRTESEIDVRYATADEIAKAKRLPADVVIFPTGMLGDLAERGFIAPLPEESLRGGEFELRDIFSQIRLSEMRWGRSTAAVSLGSPQLLLVYRRDTFDRLGIEPPKTWEEYQRLAAELQRPMENSEGASPPQSPKQPVVEATGPGYGGSLLLARAAAYVTHRDHLAPLFTLDTFTPLIDSPPYVRALEELVAAAGKSQDGATGLPSPAEVVDQVSKGDAWMGIGFPAVATPAAEDNDARADLAFAPLPGSADVYNFRTGDWEARGDDEEQRPSLVGLSGRQAAVCSGANQPQAAANFVTWLTGKEISARVAPSGSSTAPFRKSQLNATGRWLGLDEQSASSCAAALEKSLSARQTVVTLRIPGQAEYMAALDDAVQSAVSGQQSPAEALQAAAKRWNSISDRLGRKQQTLAYRRSVRAADWP
jgi:ABC-type glycerol-3-phosphate transport system substrate-binding protein